MTPPVGPRRVAIAAELLDNAEAAAAACREADLPFFVACALLEKESGGRNVYGHDKGGALSGYPGEVDRSNFDVFAWLVANGQTSNGVGPCQITYKPYFEQMIGQGLDPWDAHDNMLFGFRILKANHDATGSWGMAGARYNGGPRPGTTALVYGNDLAIKASAWFRRLGI